MPLSETEYLESDGVRLAFRRSAGDPARAGLVWLGGFHSSMAGEKATALHAAAEAAGRAFLRFDYFGHGESGGAFADGTISRWRSDALTMLDAQTSGPVVLVGSSMGAWIAILAALARPERVAGLVLLAPAADFTERLLWPQLDSHQRREIEETGQWMRESPYGDGSYPITHALIEDALDWLVMDDDIAVTVPVLILQGGRDEDVPPAHSLELVDRLRSTELVYTLVKDGDHRLSRPHDIARMVRGCLEMADAADQSRG